MIDEENLTKTSNNRIFVAQPVEVDTELVERKIDKMIAEAYDETKDIRQHIQELVPEYVIRKN